jgi:hypothetical protein
MITCNVRLMPWITVLLEKMAVLKLVKKLLYIYEACPESTDTKVLNMYIFNLQKRYCEWIAYT